MRPIRGGSAGRPRNLPAQRFASAVAVTLTLAGGTAAAADGAGSAHDLPVPAEYRLESLTPVTPAPGLNGVAALGGGQEFLFSLPAAFAIDSLTHANLDDLGSVLDRPRATYRYTWFSRPSWDVKIGMSATLDTSSNWLRSLYLTPDRLHASSLPSMHLSSQSRLADHWLLSVNAEGLRTTRGQGVDMDLRVDYSLSRNMAVFGSYRLTDSSGEVPEFYGFVPSNSAHFGVRLRF